ncbi:MAG: TVP38/TMEM64 family protein [Geopsychrobacter sp.]|nr:TVP38/TMEM64 family protein [Geopsychrobacter sp.]
MKKRRLKWLLALLWGLLLLAVFVLWRKSHLPWREIPYRLESALEDFGLYKAALIYVVIYTLRPFLLFPATLLTVTSGLLFGPWLGILFTIIGENASANVAFCVARWFGRDWVKQKSGVTLAKYEQRLLENGLVTVLILRLIMLPFDAVNYGCGLTAVRHRDYAIATFIGILPALIAFVLLGGIGAAGAGNRWWLLVGSLVFLVLGILLARWLGRREQSTDAKT